MSSIKIGKAEIPIYHYPNIAVSVSGGADSALLLYILMKELHKSQQLHLYTIGQKSTNYFNLTTARYVAMRCSELTGFTNYIHHVDHCEGQTVDKLFAKPKADFYDDVFSIFYTGFSANPPKEIADSFCGAEFNILQPIRDPNVVRNVMATHYTCTPFTNLNKQDLAEMYKELNILDSLFHYTRSCESKDPSALGTHCGECWWCKERKWGFGKL